MSVESNDTPRPEDMSPEQAPEAESPESAQATTTEQVTDELGQLQEQLAQAQAKADEHWDALLRARAEVDNIRKRSERDVSQARKYGLESIARELLPIHDSLVLGLADVEKADASLDTAREGLRLINQMLDKLMEQYSITAIDPQGEVFDPECHQAMSMQETTELAPNTVAQVLQKGYRLNDRVLRPAMVIVARAPEAAPGQNGPDSS